MFNVFFVKDKSTKEKYQPHRIVVKNTNKKYQQITERCPKWRVKAERCPGERCTRSLGQRWVKIFLMKFKFTKSNKLAERCPGQRSVSNNGKQSLQKKQREMIHEKTEAGKSKEMGYCTSSPRSIEPKASPQAEATFWCVRTWTYRSKVWTYSIIKARINYNPRLKLKRWAAPNITYVGACSRFSQIKKSAYYDRCNCSCFLCKF